MELRDSRRDFPSVHIGHANITNDRVILLSRAEQLEGIDTARRNRDIIAAQLECRLHAFEIVKVVIDDQYIAPRALLLLPAFASAI